MGVDTALLGTIAIKHDAVGQNNLDTLRRLRTDYIDIYQIHWPDPLAPIESTAEAMRSLFEQKKIHAVDNFSSAQIGRFRCVVPCTQCNLRLICLNERSKPSFSLTAPKPS
jgi:aryl-alcohol dehydrogenase-like predicted oxidoreductase